MGYFFDPTDRDDDGEYKIARWEDASSINKKVAEEVQGITTENVIAKLEDSRKIANGLTRIYLSLEKTKLGTIEVLEKMLATDENELLRVATEVDIIEKFLKSKELIKETHVKSYKNGKPIFRTYLIYGDQNSQGEYYDLGLHSELDDPNFEKGAEKHRKLTCLNGLEYGDFTAMKRRAKHLAKEIKINREKLAGFESKNELKIKMTSPQGVEKQKRFDEDLANFKAKVEKEIVPFLISYLNVNNGEFAESIKNSCKCAKDYNGGIKNENIVTYEGVKKLLGHINKKLLLYPKTQQGEK